MPQVNHLVLMQIKAEVGQGQIDALYKELAGLVPLIPGLLSFSGGPYSSPEGFNKQWGHGFSMVFADEASRDAYLPHPEHERVRDLLLPLVDDVVAFDYLLPQLESVKSAADVLTFWFGQEYFADKSQLSLDAYLSGRSKSLWYAGSSVDEACRAFVPTIEAAAAGSLAGQDLDDQMARIILFDQLARNAHRGTAEALAYDDLAVKQARAIVEKEVEFTPAHVCFVVSPLLHSERLEDHDLGLALSTRSIERWPENGQVKYVKRFCQEHRDVIEKFGRYPHRNAAKGRESSADEEAWLASEGCPSWAKSQQAPKRQVNHLVLMQIKAEVGQGQIDALYKELAGLVPLIPGLLSFSGGPYSSPEGFNKQWGHGFSMVFADEASRDAYLPHPEHERVRDLLLPLVDDVVAFDYLL